ncbi:hypothetical protein GBAR_LOCUS10541, partial [Geodia barretti]
CIIYRWFATGSKTGCRPEKRVSEPVQPGHTGSGIARRTATSFPPDKFRRRDRRNFHEAPHLRLPQSYTAQQLLKLFQKRYPSVYKTRIFKAEDEEEGGEGDRSDDGDSEEELQQEGGVRLPGGSTRRGRGLSQALGGRRRQQSFFNSSSSSMMTSQKGVVYFSDLDQLRAALKEMHNYRLVTRTSRSGGFASQVTSICYLDVRLDDDFGQSDDDDTSLLHGNQSLLTLSHGNSLRDRQKPD